MEFVDLLTRGEEHGFLQLTEWERKSVKKTKWMKNNKPFIMKSIKPGKKEHNMLCAP